MDTKAESDHVEVYDTTMSDAENHAFEQEHHLTLWQAAKAFPRVLPLAAVAGLAGMMFGYDQIANNATLGMTGFFLYFGAFTATGEAYYPTVWTSLWTAMSSLAQALGGMFIAPISDRFGRKKAILCACLISAAGVAVQFTSTSRGMLLAGKMVNGLAIRAALSTATAWASEIAPVRLRGPVQSSIVLVTVMMQALGLVVVQQEAATPKPSGFRIVFGVQWAFCVATFIMFLLVPESPTWLILRGREDAARKSVRQIYGSKSNHEARYRYILSQIQSEAAIEHVSGIGGYLELYKGSNLKRTLTVHLLFFGAGLAGATFLSQSIYVLELIGMPTAEVYDVSIAGFVIAFFAIIASWTILERVGRRSFWFVGCGVNIVGMAIIGGLAYAPGKASLWVAGILMNLLISWQSLTISSMSWIIAGEISPYRLRSKNQAVAVLSNAITTWLFSFVVPYMYNVASGDLKTRTGFVFAGATVLLFIVSWPLVPDLRGFTPAEIDWLYQSKIAVRKFQQYADGRAAEGAGAVVAGAQKEEGV